ncbi:MAG: MFS transporter [Gammaproteobacteria bacterium]|nr:MFS transporter [Gammaproteobacteria bacterium]MCP5137352.1 MFS transporter [Gammaproteobacteria bacterium]
MLASERWAIGSLAGIYFLRMFGLFLILPVFALYAERLDGHTAALTGLAIGIYGLTQAGLQIPFGLASDRFGRKPVITAGLIMFAIGSVVAATSTHIHGVILGRALQGSGAIAAAVMALNADLTREVIRTRAMAIIGMSIGAAFFAAMLGGPILSQWIGVPGLFWLTAALALLGLVVIHTITPNPVESRVHRDAEPVLGQLGQVLRDPQLLRLDSGIFLLHMILTALFIAVPLALRDQIGMPGGEHWKVYLPVMLLSIPAMVPFVILAEAKGQMKAVFLGAVGMIGLAQLALAWSHSDIWWIGAVLWGFFTAFNILEATLPSLISKMAPPDKKGSAMGVYSSSQFFGAFLGGALGGVMLGHFGVSGIFALTASAALLWLMIAVGMRAPAGLSNYLLQVGVCDEARASAMSARLLQITGVADAVVVAEDGVAYLKVNQRLLDEESLREFAVAD